MKRQDTQKEAIQQIAEEIDTRETDGSEDKIDEASHGDDYTVPEPDIRPEEAGEEEQDVFAVLDVGLAETEEEPEEMLSTELKRPCGRRDEE